MDPPTDLPDLVEDLEVNIDELTEKLSPLLTTRLSTTASTLPLLDKAKLYILAAYSVESLLYSALQASGTDAKEHAIFAELGRLKGYFAKVKDVEKASGPQEPPSRKVDVGAAARFIRHGLAGNERLDLEREERAAKERARASLKAKLVNKKFDEEGSEVSAGASSVPLKRSAGEMGLDRGQEEDDDDEKILGGLEDIEPEKTITPALKKAKLSDADTKDIDTTASQIPKSKKHKKSGHIQPHEPRNQETKSERKRQHGKDKKDRKKAKKASKENPV